MISGFRFLAKDLVKNNNRWVRPVLQVFSAQVVIRALAFGVSFILIRTMPKSDYAIYTVLMSVQGLLRVLSNSGIMTGFKFIGGNIWNDERALSSLIRTAFSIRVITLAIAIIIASVYGSFILYQQGLSIWMIGLTIGAIVLFVLPDINRSFIGESFLLQKKISIIQIAGLLEHVSRFFLVVLLYLVLSGHIEIEYVLAITVLTTWLTYCFTLIKSHDLRKVNPVINPDYKKTLIKYIKLNWHNSTFFAFKSQITIFIIGVFGSTESVANLGALTRYTLIFTMLSPVVHQIFAPAYGREQNNSRLTKFFILTLMGLFIFSLVLLTIVFIFPEPFLWVLGEKYSGLQYELFLVFVSGIIAFSTKIINFLNMAKGWIKFSPGWEIPLNIISMLIGVLIFDLSSLVGVLYFGILTMLSNLIVYLLNSFGGLKMDRH